MINKKGEGEQFNWIFVIIAGAIILAFFVLFTTKYIRLQQDREDLRSVRDFGGTLSILESLPITDVGASIDSSKPGQGLNFGYNIDMKYDCIGETAKRKIGKGSYTDYQLKDQILFIKSQQKIKQLDMWLLPWRYPFHITNLIYLSDPDKTYYLIYDTNTKEFVENLELSNAFTIETTNVIKPKEKSTYIIFSKNKLSKEKVLNLIADSSTINFVYINPKDEDTGEVSFFQNGEWSKNVNYYGKELMYGAIFSDDYENYKCTLDKSFKKLRDSASIYSEKAGILEHINNNPECKYGNIQDTLKKFSNGIYGLKKDLENQNRLGTGCLEVY